MRKHGTNRPSIAAILAISALLVTSLVGSAFAARTGSSSVSGNAVWLVDEADKGCVNGTVNTADNLITSDGYWIALWIKVTDKGLPNSVRIENNGKQIDQVGLGTDWQNCGPNFTLGYFFYDDGDGAKPDSLTVTALKDGEVWASDSARFD